MKEKKSPRRRLLIWSAVAITAPVGISILGFLLRDACTPPEYRAVARVKFEPPRSSAGPEAMAEAWRTRKIPEAFGNLVAMESFDIVSRVGLRLSQEERKAILSPYQEGSIFLGPLNVEEVLVKSRRIVPDREPFVADIVYTHGDREIARRMADYFGQEIVRANEEANTRGRDPLLERIQEELLQMRQDILDLSAKHRALDGKNGEKTTSGADAESRSLKQGIEVREKNYEELSRIYKVKRAAAETGRNRMSLASATVDTAPANKGVRRALLSGLTLGGIIGLGVAIGCGGIILGGRLLRLRL